MKMIGKCADIEIGRATKTFFLGECTECRVILPYRYQQTRASMASILNSLAPVIVLLHQFNYTQCKVSRGCLSLQITF